MLKKPTKRAKGYSKSEMLAYQKKVLKAFLGPNISRHKNPTQLELLTATNAKLTYLTDELEGMRGRVERMTDREAQARDRRAFSEKINKIAGMRQAAAKIIAELSVSHWGRIAPKEDMVSYGVELAQMIEQKINP